MIFHLLRKVRLSKAAKTFRAAQDAYVDAVRRGDTRDQHAAKQRLIDAQHARLRVEVRG